MRVTHILGYWKPLALQCGGGGRDIDNDAPDRCKECCITCCTNAKQAAKTRPMVHTGIYVRLENDQGNGFYKTETAKHISRRISIKNPSAKNAEGLRQLYNSTGNEYWLPVRPGLTLRDILNDKRMNGRFYTIGGRVTGLCCCSDFCCAKTFGKTTGDMWVCHNYAWDFYIICGYDPIPEEPDHRCKRWRRDDRFRGPCRGVEPSPQGVHTEQVARQGGSVRGHGGSSREGGSYMTVAASRV